MNRNSRVRRLERAIARDPTLFEPEPMIQLLLAILPSWQLGVLMQAVQESIGAVQESLGEDGQSITHRT